MRYYAHIAVHCKGESHMDIEELRKFCLNLPHTTEDVKWGSDLCFCIGGKMYCVTAVDSHANAPMSFKCTPEKFGQLTEVEGIEPAAYVARYHWVSVKDPNAISKDELRDLIRESYQMVFDKLPAKIRKNRT